jgi:hypothetical protein
MGGIPVNSDEIIGVKMPTVMLKETGRKKALVNTGQNMGRKISPDAVAWKTIGIKIPIAINRALSVNFRER